MTEPFRQLHHDDLSEETLGVQGRGNKGDGPSRRLGDPDPHGRKSAPLVPD